jgi:hypothetical protein
MLMSGSTQVRRRPRWIALDCLNSVAGPHWVVRVESLRVAFLAACGVKRSRERARRPIRRRPKTAHRLFSEYSAPCSAAQASAHAARRRLGPRHPPSSGAAAPPPPRCAGSRPRQPSDAARRVESVLGHRSSVQVKSRNSTLAGWPDGHLTASANFHHERGRYRSRSGWTQATCTGWRRRCRP